MISPTAAPFSRRRLLGGAAGLAGAALLAGLTVVSKVIPDVAIAQLDEASRRRASAWELAVKNVTVIPFTTVWMVIGMRHAVDQARP